MTIMIKDKEHNRTVHYDNLKLIRVRDGVITILDKDGWGTRENIMDFVIEIREEKDYE